MRVRPCVTVVVVTYQSATDIASCLQSVFDTAEAWIADCRVIDNASTDATVRIVTQQFPHVKLTAGTTNLGFSRAVNQAAAGVESEFLLVLNPDTILFPNALAELAHFLDHRPQASACGPYIEDELGEFQTYSRRGFPTPANSFGRLFGLDRLMPDSRWGSYRQAKLDRAQEMMTDALSGSCMLLRTSAFQTAGGFDEDYFLFGEDLDLCWKLNRAGGEVWYIPSAKLRHRKGVSMSHASRLAKREFYRAMLLYIDKRMADDYSGPSRALMKCGVRFRRMLGAVPGWSIE